MAHQRTSPANQSVQSSYCFEQNGLFGAVARGLGFDVIDGAARVVQVCTFMLLPLPWWRLVQLARQPEGAAACIACHNEHSSKYPLPQRVCDGAAFAPLLTLQASDADASEVEEAPPLPGRSPASQKGILEEAPRELARLLGAP